MKAGDEVICINADNIDNRIDNKPAYLAHYHVRAIIKYMISKPGAVGLLLDEIENKVVEGHNGSHEPTFDINRFATPQELPEEMMVVEELETA